MVLLILLLFRPGPDGAFPVRRAAARVIWQPNTGATRYRTGAGAYRLIALFGLAHALIRKPVPTIETRPCSSVPIPEFVSPHDANFEFGTLVLQHNVPESGSPSCRIY